MLTHVDFNTDLVQWGNIGFEYDSNGIALENLFCFSVCVCVCVCVRVCVHVCVCVKYA